MRNAMKKTMAVLAVVGGLLPISACEVTPPEDVPGDADTGVPVVPEP